MPMPCHPQNTGQSEPRFGAAMAELYAYTRKLPPESWDATGILQMPPWQYSTLGACNGQEQQCLAK